MSLLKTTSSSSSCEQTFTSQSDIKCSVLPVTPHYNKEAVIQYVASFDICLDQFFIEQGDTVSIQQDRCLPPPRAYHRTKGEHHHIHQPAAIEYSASSCAYSTIELIRAYRQAVGLEIERFEPGRWSAASRFDAAACDAHAAQRTGCPTKQPHRNIGEREHRDAE